MGRGEFRMGLGLYCRSLVCTTFYDLPKVLTLSARDARTGPGLLYGSYAYGSFPEFSQCQAVGINILGNADQSILFLSHLIDASPCLYKLVLKVNLLT